MKRLMSMLVLIIMMIVLPVSPVFSLADPFGIGVVYRDSGEDHPWGGEDHRDDNDTGSAVQGEIDFGGGISGYLSVDLVNYFFGFFVDRFASFNDTRTKSYVIVTTPVPTETEDPIPTVNHNGN